MALVKISLSDLSSLAHVKLEPIEGKLAALGIPLEKQEGDELAVEITPNRPDWLSVEGIARSLRDFSSRQPTTYPVSHSGVEWHIEGSVREDRPFLGSALVQGVKMADELVASMMQLQEKLHDTLGRNRRKLAIGLHDFSTVQPPFTYKTCGREEIRFAPLGSAVPMTPGQILSTHEKGIEFAHLVGSRCPMIVDCDGAVLSFPPIINGERTRLGSQTHGVLIDCTGTSASAVRSAVQIVAAALAERGGRVHDVKIGGEIYPIFEPVKSPLPTGAASKLLGVKLSARDAAAHLMKMGHVVKAGVVHSPAWRADIMHAVDLIEDIAISYGYNEFEPATPSFHSEGKSSHAFSPFHSAMLGLGYFEAQSWHLTNEKVLRAAKVDPAACMRVENPLTEEFTTLRPALYPNLLDVLAHSRSQPMPQAIYEIGPVFSGHERTHLAFVLTHPKCNWTELKSHICGLAQSCLVPFEFSEAEMPGLIDGRAARLSWSGEKIGFAGEVHPEVLEAFSLEQPAALFEIELDSLLQKKAIC